MANIFKVFETNQFIKDLNDDFSGRQERLRAKLHACVYPQLRQQPYFGKHIKKLRGYLPETWRYRIGDYRFFYSIDASRKVIFMIAVDHRSSAY
ncbi:MAG: type II toxin-antitoxin system RelE/ParE family toxin [Candidatus Omnitrophica bacterium]|nr:type II toxin-antitoxin system RelE/ParE family toxin [Candidatus Omnitrophota bacterium]